MLDYARGIESIGDPSLTLDILSVLQNHFEIAEEHARTGFHPDMDADENN